MILDRLEDQIDLCLAKSKNAELDRQMSRLVEGNFHSLTLTTFPERFQPGNYQEYF